MKFLKVVLLGLSLLVGLESFATSKATVLRFSVDDALLQPKKPRFLIFDTSILFPNAFELTAKIGSNSPVKIIWKRRKCEMQPCDYFHGWEAQVPYHEDLSVFVTFVPTDEVECENTCFAYPHEWTLSVSLSGNNKNVVDQKGFLIGPKRVVSNIGGKAPFILEGETVNGIEYQAKVSPNGEVHILYTPYDLKEGHSYED